MFKIPTDPTLIQTLLEAEPVSREGDIEKNTLESTLIDQFPKPVTSQFDSFELEVEAAMLNPTSICDIRSPQKKRCPS